MSYKCENCDEVWEKYVYNKRFCDRKCKDKVYNATVVKKKKYSLRNTTESKPKMNLESQKMSYLFDKKTSDVIEVRKNTDKEQAMIDAFLANN